MKSFNPPLRTLMGPGPSDVHPRVTQAMARPVIGHMDPAFIGMMDEIKDGLRLAFQTENTMTFPVSAPGSAGMELCFANLVEPGDTVVICQNGVFGTRMKENVERFGGTPIMVEDDWGNPVDLNHLEETLNANPQAKIVAFVHAETSTGVRSDADEIAKLAHKHDCLVIMDAVTSLGGIPVLIDQWQVDAVYSGTQKCLSCAPGLSPVSLSNRALDCIRARKTTVASWFLDVSLLMKYYEDNPSGTGPARVYHHTAPVSALYGLHEALVMLHEESLAAAHTRHQKMHQALKAGLEAMGLSLYVEEAYRLPQLNAVTIPDNIDEAAVRKHLLTAYNLEIGAGLGALAGKIWRIGLMGQSATPNNIVLCLSALEDALSSAQAPIAKGEALAAALAQLS